MLSQVCSLCLVLKKQSLLLFCSSEQHTDYKSAGAWGIKLVGWLYMGIMGKLKKIKSHMRKIILSFISLTVLCGCNIKTEKINSKHNAENVERINSDFYKYLSTLDSIPLPLEHNSMGKFPNLSKKFDKSGFEKYKHTWTSQPLGIYYRDSMTIGIIDCSIGDWGLVPFLTTYDLKGNKIDSTSFYEKSGQDLGYEAIEHLTLNQNRTITLTDTVKRWDINKDQTDIIDGSLKMTTGKVEFRIQENGQIVKSHAGASL